MPCGVEVQIVGDEPALACVLHHALDDRVPRLDCLENVAIVQLRADVISQRRDVREVREQVDLSDGGARLANASGGPSTNWRKLFEQALLDLDAALVCSEDAALEIFQLGSREALRVDQGLLALVVARAHSPGSIW